MRNWALHYDGLRTGFPDVIWKFEGEGNLYLVMRAPYLREATIGYSMISCPPGQEWNPRAAKSIMFLEGKTSTEFEQMFHERYPHFPLPADLEEKYDIMVRTQLNFLKRICVSR